MNKFLKELSNQSLKYLNKKEAKELTSFYEEIINDRLSNGENINDILNDYNINTIIKDYLPDAILKRKNKPVKNTLQILLLLFSTPILIPLAILYLALIIVVLSLVITGVSISISAILFIIPYLLEVFNYKQTIGSIMGLSSIGIILSTLFIYIGYILTISMYKLSIYMSKVFINPIKRRRGAK